MIAIFNNKKGVTVLEGLIALGLLALVATGTFSVLLSVSRKGTNPDMREEMIYAVEKANNLLQGYILHQANYTADFSSVITPGILSVSSAGYNFIASSGSTFIGADFSKGLCGNSSVYKKVDNTPLAVGNHEINCLLPPICNRGNSNFVYNVAVINPTPSDKVIAGAAQGAFEDDAYIITGGADIKQLEITYTINCNGFTL